jgi:transposase
MPPRRKLSTQDLGHALGWLQDGISRRNVARRLKVSHSAIQRFHQRFQDPGRVEERPRSGWPRISTRQDNRYLMLTALHSSNITETTLRQELRRMTSIHASFQTIWGRLHNINLRSESPAVRVLLTRRHRQTRMQRCWVYQRWTSRQWSLVLFPDKSRFCLTRSNCHIRVWRRPGEGRPDGCVWEHDCYGGGSLMVWGGIHLHGRTPLQLLPGRLTAAMSRNEIVRPLIITILQAMRPGTTLMDDNATPHRTRVVNDHLRQQQVPPMDWSSRSPDLNPIHKLWDLMERRVQDNHPRLLTSTSCSHFCSRSGLQWLSILLWHSSSL